MVSCLIFISNNHSAYAYGVYGHHHGYRHHYGYGHGVHGHYSHHGGIGTAGYVILGLLGVAVLSHLFNEDRRNNHSRYQRIDKPREYKRIRHRPAPYPRVSRSIASYKTANYGVNEGWQNLKHQNTRNAMKIFAIQSQQNPASGKTRIGFALSAAANGELERGIWSMRKALTSEPTALSTLQIDSQINSIIEQLRSQYRDHVFAAESRQHQAFMLSALSYLQGDLDSADNHIHLADDSLPSNNLRVLINSGRT